MYNYRIGSSFTMMNRFEYTQVKYMPSRYREGGEMILFDAQYRKNSSPLSMKVRFIMFDSDSYDSRLYEYESNVPGSFSDPPLYGKGIRWYMLVRYHVSKSLVASIRYSETKKVGVAVIGSGDSQIQGNLDNQIAAQLDLEL